MDDYEQIASLKYELENPVLKNQAIHYGGIIKVADDIRCMLEWLILEGSTGYYYELGYFRLDMLSKHDWKILARVWKWLYLKPNDRIAHFIKFFSAL